MAKQIEVSFFPIEKIQAYANNARAHSCSQIQQIAHSIREFGFMSPILIDKHNTIIAGHGRLLAAREIGLEVIPAIRTDHLTPAQVRAYRLADNKIADNAGWDENLLKIEKRRNEIADSMKRMTPGRSVSSEGANYLRTPHENE